MNKCFVCKKDTNDVKVSYDVYDVIGKKYSHNIMYLCHQCYIDWKESIEQFVVMRDKNEKYQTYTMNESINTSNTNFNSDKLIKKTDTIPSISWGKRQKMPKITDNDIIDFHEFLKNNNIVRYFKDETNRKI